MKKWFFYGFPFLLALSFLLGQRTAHVFRRDSSVAPATLSLNTTTSSQTQNPAAQLLRNYPQNQSHHSYLREHEIAQRLTYLQHLATLGAPSEALLQTYETLLQNRKEEWIIQRQVLKNLQPYLAQLNEKKRDTLLSQVDLRARTTYQLSDKDFIQLFERVP